MVTLQENGMTRITVTLRPDDVRLLDRMARVGGSSRSEELRSLIAMARPTLESVISVVEAALEKRAQLDAAVRDATESELSQISEEVERLQAAFVGTLSRLEGARAAAESGAES